MQTKFRNIKQIREKELIMNEKLRINVGFIIIAAERISSDTEVVLGFNPLTGQYATWMCVDGDNYFWGHYGTSFFKASDDFRRRCSR